MARASTGGVFSRQTLSCSRRPSSSGWAASPPHSANSLSAICRHNLRSSASRWSCVRLRIRPGPEVAQVDRAASGGLAPVHADRHLGHGLGDLGDLPAADDQRPEERLGNEADAGVEDGGLHGQCSAHGKGLAGPTGQRRRGGRANKAASMDAKTHEAYSRKKLTGTKASVPLRTGAVQQWRPRCAARFFGGVEGHGSTLLSSRARRSISVTARTAEYSWLRSGWRIARKTGRTPRTPAFQPRAFVAECPFLVLRIAGLDWLNTEVIHGNQA